MFAAHTDKFNSSDILGFWSVFSSSLNFIHNFDRHEFLANSARESTITIIHETTQEFQKYFYNIKHCIYDSLDLTPPFSGTRSRRLLFNS